MTFNLFSLIPAHFAPRHGKASQLVRSLFVAALMITLALNTTPSIAEPLSSGAGWAALKSNIDPKVEAVMIQEKILGMTVAVSRKGKLVLSRGYGLSFKSGTKATAMTRTLRTRIGSTGKALITGPVTWRLLSDNNLDSASTKLYGNGSIFGTKFDSDQANARKRFGKIAGIAIAPDDDVYTWYRNRTVSIGRSNDLDRSGAPKSFELAENTKIYDIRAIAIAGSTSKTYVWYNSGALSIGTSRDLDRYKKISLDEKGKQKREVTFPSGKNMWNVVGIAIAKSNDHVYVWYDDGTVSSGTSTDFTRYFVDRKFSLPIDSLRYHLIDLGIAANDRVYAWFDTGKASSGTSWDLDKYRPFYSYSTPSTGATRNLYPSITVQHLYDHYSGFNGSGDTPDAAIMFGKSADQLTYEQVHRHFLRTRPLQGKPGDSYSYSNHGFGMLTMVIEKFAGRSYRQEAIEAYLKPLALKGLVRPQTVNTDSSDSHAYTLSNGQHRDHAAKNTTLGLAAGGWTASAGSILKITTALAERYSTAELDRMGWGKNSKDALSHSGKVGGGAAYVVMFPDGYISNSGQDLSGVHVAIASNTEIGTGALRTLANQIAVQVPVSSIPGNFQISWGKPLS